MPSAGHWSSIYRQGFEYHVVCIDMFFIVKAYKKKKGFLLLRLCVKAQEATKQNSV